ncbi:MAG: DUF2971 domain-containing protein [Pseudomonadota bacterium]
MNPKDDNFILSTGKNQSKTEIYHYTGADGLLGIIKEGQLRATHSGFLNDKEERIGFFDRRLPFLLRPTIEQAIAELTRRGQISPLTNDDHDALDKTIRQLTSSFRDVSLKSLEMYVVSLCTPSANDHDHGLLSQWRGYGKGGGYAIVFDANSFSAGLEFEATNHAYQALGYGHVEYFAPDGSGQSTHKKILSYESVIQKKVLESLLSDDQNSIVDEDMHFTMQILSCLQKHRGFQEEAEVRFYAAPASDETYQAYLEYGPERPLKQVHFRTKDGLLVPYINLRITMEDSKVNPIKRVIVGPHPDSERRRKSVEMLLSKYKINAEVVCSTIPLVD